MAVWIKIVVLRFPCGIESKIYSFFGGGELTVESR